MTTLALVLGAGLAVLCVVYVARPFLREPQPIDDRLDVLDEWERRRLEVTEERDRALAALKELEFEHRTGAISDDDYRALVGPLRRQAADALRALEPAAKRPVAGDAAVYRADGTAMESVGKPIQRGGAQMAAIRDRPWQRAASVVRPEPDPGPPQQPTVPEPTPVPHEPPEPPNIPEPTPVPHEPPEPPNIPEPTPVPHEPPRQPDVPEPYPEPPSGR
jgi:hypothetical protein